MNRKERRGAAKGAGGPPPLLAQAAKQFREGKLPAAEATLRQFLLTQPNNFDALYMLGVVAAQNGRNDEAVTLIGKVVAQRPGFADAHNDLGRIFLLKGEVDNALASFRRAIAAAPGLAIAHANLGATLRRKGDVAAAVASFRRALSLDPNVGGGALEELVHIQQLTCDWAGLADNISRLLKVAEHGPGVVRPYSVLGLTDSPATALANTRRWAERFFAGAGTRFVHKAKRPEQRIRVGYLSADFRTHAASYAIVEVFERHNRDRFEVFGYSIGPDDGTDLRKRVAAAFDHFADVRNLADAEIADRIHTDGIDILVDLQGYTDLSRPRIVSDRPAPIQVNWLGYASTMGVDFIDYILLDPVVAPIDHQRFFTETIVRLPHCYYPNDSTRQVAEATPARRDLGLPENGFVFCCFNSTWKITADRFASWMRILAAVPGSVMCFIGDDTVKRNLSREAKARGVDPARLVFVPKLPMAEYLARFRVADLFLDTLPYTAHGTATDALWAGLPVLTQAGAGFPARVAASMLTAIGLPELIVESEAEYEGLAIRLAADEALLAGYRERLARNRLTTPLFDTAALTKDVEAAFETMLRRRLETAAPT